MEYYSSDFFAQQDSAIRRSRLFVVLYLFALIGTVAVAYIPMLILLGPLLMYIHYYSMYLESGEFSIPVNASSIFNFFFDIGLGDPFVLITTMAITLILVLGASVMRLLWLKRGGGDAVLSLFNGRELVYDGANLHEKRLYNVVNEMSIASGVPCPKIYILDGQQGINAFAAGHSMYEAVIGVSEGCLTRLNRDELQAVIGHEFSHIKNGDMKLNINLLGMLFGLQVLVLLGKKLIYLSSSSSRGYDYNLIHSRKHSRYNGISTSIIAGGILVFVGSIGVLFARLVKAAISRQREYLADASSVQFTRNPSGITGALKKIAGYVHSSRIRHPSSEEISHMCFSNCLAPSYFRKLLSTHPPIDKRILRFQPDFEVPEIKSSLPIVDVDSRERFITSNFSNVDSSSIGFQHKDTRSLGIDDPPQSSGFFIGQQSSFAISPEELVDSVGTVAGKHIEVAKVLISKVPEEVHKIRHTKAGALAVLLMMFLLEDPAVKGKQIQIIEDRIPKSSYKIFLKLYRKIEKVDLKLRLVILDLISPILRSMQRDEKVDLRALMVKLMNVDGKVSTFEYALIQNVLLLINGRIISNYNSENGNVNVLHAVSTTLSLVVGSSRAIKSHVGTSSMLRFSENIFNYSKAPFEKEFGDSIYFTDHRDINLRDFHRSLIVLNSTCPKLKKAILSSIARAVAADGEVSVEEAELFRVVAGALECPIPPILATFH